MKENSASVFQTVGIIAAMQIEIDGIREKLQDVCIET